MRSLADRLGGAGFVLALVTLAACDSLVPTSSPTPMSPSPTATDQLHPTPTATARVTPEPTAAVDVPEPGRPWDGPALLGEMAASTRPDGVPASIRTAQVAEGIAEAIWTVDGAAWDTFAIGGFCGATTCTVEVAGTHLGRVAEDLWVLEVDPTSASVDVISADVRSLRPELVEEIDALARDVIDLDGMILGTTRWVPPPAGEGRFELSYRSGGEEGSCRREVTLDAAAGEVVEETASGC